jgi:cation:H+ antiporter
MFSAFGGNTDLAIWNIIGSNIANIFLILWIASFIYPLRAQVWTVYKEIPFALLAVILVAIVANDMYIDGDISNTISRIDGLILLWFFCIFLFYTFWIAKNNPQEAAENNELEILSLPKSIFYIILGLVWLTLGWKWIVDGAIQIANVFWMSEAVIWLTVVAIWTSLPELATSVVAALKKQTDIAIWNIIGSNIFNIFWILWLTAVITPLSYQSSLNTDVFVNIWATLFLFICMFVWKKYVIQKWQWILMIMFYFIYITFLVFSNI